MVAFKARVREPRGRNQSAVCAVGLSLLFLSLGGVFARYAGIQTDEALFAGPLCRPWRFYSIRLGPYDVPLMNMPYNGALKTWLYAPVLAGAAHPTAALIRMPAILAGCATILMLWGLLRRIHGRVAAWTACTLVATDTSFLLMTAYDWGPVALQHLLLVAAMFFAVHWFQTNGRFSLPAAGFCCGLAYWDKAEFVWVSAGVFAGLLLFTPGIRARLTRWGVAGALGGVFLGALPLVVYNAAGNPKLGTLHANSHLGSDLAASDFARKALVLGGTLDGSALFGYLVNEDAAPQPKSPRAMVERASFQMRRIIGEHRHNGMPLAFCAALILFPVLWRTGACKAMAFSLIAIVVAWWFMASTGGGGSAHQAVLLWPLPHIFIAIAFAEAARHVRLGGWILFAVVSLAALSSLLVTNQYFYQLIRNGAGDVWSDGIFSLADNLRQSGASQVVLPDWGMTDSLCVLTHDRPTGHPVGDSFLANTSPGPQREYDLQTLSDPKAVWIEHAPGHEMLPGVNDRIRAAAHRAGFDPLLLQTYFDSNGRAIFQAFRFTSALQQASGH
jgi:hypothetical protein